MESHANLYEDGLKIYTTLNLNMQKHAEFAADHHMKKSSACI